MSRKRYGLSALAACALAALALALFLSSARDVERPSVRGRALRLPHGSMHALIQGTGSPAVVIEAGFGPSAEWWPIADALSSHTQTFVYDRAGLLGSDRGPSPRSPSQIASELWHALRAAGIEPPLVLIGESIGALHVQAFARAHPESIAAMVLVDPLASLDARFARELPKAVHQNLLNLAPRLELGRALASLGLVRALRALPYEHPPADRAPLLDFFATPSSYTTLLAEYRAAKRAPSPAELPPCPLHVVHHASERFVDELMFLQISYDEAWAIERLWQDVNRETAALSPLGELRFARRATRHLHMQEPELVIEAALAAVHAERALARP